jgi:hypothetical protein
VGRSADRQMGRSSPRKRRPIVGRMDSRLRGNDVIFESAVGGEESCSVLKTLRARFLHFVQDRLFAALRMTAKGSE